MFSLLLLPVLAALSATATARSPYDVSKAEWDMFNATVEGRLAHGVPFARACFSQVGVNVTSGGADCTTVQAKYGDEVFRADHFGAAMRGNWEACQKTNQDCLLDDHNPANATAFTPPRVCNQGSVAPYYIAIKNATDVANAFAFSSRTRVPLSIKNSGHDYSGKSTVPGTLALWTHNIKYINYSKLFVPEGCYTTGVPTVTYGAGQDMESLFLFAEANNITFVGGTARTVGAAGGWLQGAGHSLLSNLYGLGADRVRQFRVVTPDGKYRVANACQNSDLFWALRGGGGGTFGVVMEATVEVIPKALSAVNLLWTIDPTPANIQGLMKILIDNGIQWAKDGWGGYVYATTSILVNPRLNGTAAAASLKPLTDFLQTGAGNSSSQWINYPTLLPLFSLIVSNGIAPGIRGALASRLIPQSLFEPANAPALLNATVESLRLSAGSTLLHLTTPFSYADTAGATSVSPAWRGALWHVITSSHWEWDASPDVAKAGFAEASKAIDPFRKLTPGGGSYMNEADTYEPDWSASFWGSNYNRLYALKQKYDPKKLLDCYHCVGWQGNRTPIASCYF